MEHEDTTVQVKHGLLRGQVVSLESGSKFFSFKGIPYAKPPIDDLRFKVAQPPDPWEGVRDALIEGSPSPQIDWILQLPYRGNEDCLYLNVYTPKLPKEDCKLKFPVLVWIHGGGFEVGCGDSNLYGPDYLVNEDVILVTINYRLGILGFLSVEHPAQSENIGLKDQVAALRWVQENIATFGGDKNNVTIFGESAGGASVHYHLLSPMSKGLFHKAIMQSGCALNEWAQARSCRDLAFEIGKELGCASADETELIKFLQDVPAKTLVETYHNITKKHMGGKQWHFGPVPETNNSGNEVFLPSNPKDLMMKGKFDNIPCIIGINSQEGIFFASIIGVLKDPSTLRHIGQNFETQIPHGTDLKRSRLEATKEIRKFYFNNKPLSETSLNSFIDFSSDVWFAKGIDQTMTTLAENQSPVYYYCFDFSGNMNIFKNLIKSQAFTGASHMDELGYIFATPFFSTPKPEMKSSDWTTLRRMVRMWTDFAKTGNPTPSCDDIVNVTWPTFTSENPVCLNITDTLSLAQNQFADRINFWRNL